MNELFVLKAIIKTDLFPFGYHTLRTLIANGERFKKGLLPEDREYIIARNYGSLKRKIWCVDKKELLAWNDRKIELNNL